MKTRSFSGPAVVLVLSLLLLGAGTARSGEIPLQTPLSNEILTRSHLFKADQKDGLWACYHLIVADQDLLVLSREEAAGLLLAAFGSAPGRQGYESAWVELRAVSGGDTVFGKAHGPGGGPARADLSMFPTNRAVFSVSSRIRTRIAKEMNGFFEDVVKFFEEKVRKKVSPSQPDRSGELEL